MKFTDQGNKKIIEFEEHDSNSEKRIVEQGLAFMRNLMCRINEVAENKTQGDSK